MSNGNWLENEDLDVKTRSLNHIGSPGVWHSQKTKK